MIFQIKVEDTIPGRLRRKADTVGPELVKRVNQMLTTIETVVRFVTPRGKHCPNRGVAGNLKSNIRHELTGTGGRVYLDLQGAPYGKYVLGGRGPVKAKYNKTYLGKSVGGAKVLHFCIAGKDIFVRSVKASKPNDFMKTGYDQSIPKVQAHAEALGKWLEAI